MIRLYDGNNQFRIRLETDPTGLTVRNFYNEVMSCQDLVVFCWDGFDCNKRRRDLYPKYKVGRQPPADRVFESMKLFKQVLKMSNAIQVEVPRYEADDLIATLALKYQYHDRVHIYSNDGDFVQLVNARVGVERGEFKGGIDPKYVRLYKTLVGDSTDKIGGIRLFGDEAWAEADKEAWTAYIAGTGPRPPVKKSVGKWLDENHQTLLNMWTITGFFTIPAEEIQQGTHVGVPARDKVEEILRSFWL